tara:strand:- start:2860 stop:3003 length:144 start_codon:yes stop_codon:yes gene_type:complete
MCKSLTLLPCREKICRICLDNLEGYHSEHIRMEAAIESKEWEGWKDE